MIDTLLIIVGAILVIGGIAVALNIGGVADRLRRHSQSPQGDPSSTPTEMHFAARLWGVALLFVGVLCVILGLIV